VGPDGAKRCRGGILTTPDCATPSWQKWETRCRDERCRYASYDRALIFFLLHEQPSQYRERTLSELFRVVKPGGKIIVVDYDLPRWWQPIRYIWLNRPQAAPGSYISP
jgi:SAM-dependent methyltransferase